jgi:hypothetical protein
LNFEDIFYSFAVIRHGKLWAFFPTCCIRRWISEYIQALPNSENPQATSQGDWGPSDICAQQVDYLPILKAIADELDLVGLVDRLVISEMCVSCGLAVLGLVLDTLSGRSPLYRLVEFLEDRDARAPLG